MSTAAMKHFLTSKILPLLITSLIVILGLPRLDQLNGNLSKTQQLLSRISQEPKLETYTTDMMAYLRTYYEVRSGHPYYLSLSNSVVGDATRDNQPEEIWGWKLPFIFYFWSILPGPAGTSVYFGFVILLITTLFASYKLSSKINHKFAWVSPYLLLGYFILPLTEITLFQVEWWAACFFIIGLTFLIYQKKLWAMTFFLFCILTRELFLVHLAMLAIVYLLYRRYRDIWIFAVPAVSLILFYIFYHLPNVYQFESFGPMTSWWRGNVQRGWYLVRPTLSYSSWNYFFYFLYPFRIILSFAVIGLIRQIQQSKNKFAPLLSLFSFLPFFIFIFFVGIQTKWQDYWGIYYLPLSLIFAPTIISLVKHDKN